MFETVPFSAGKTAKILIPLCTGCPSQEGFGSWTLGGYKTQATTNYLDHNSVGLATSRALPRARNSRAGLLLQKTFVHGDRTYHLAHRHVTHMHRVVGELGRTARDRHYQSCSRGAQLISLSVVVAHCFFLTTHR